VQSNLPGVHIILAAIIMGLLLCGLLLCARLIMCDTYVAAGEYWRIRSRPSSAAEYKLRGVFLLGMHASWLDYVLDYNSSS
jgi:hypothetical protein